MLRVCRELESWRAGKLGFGLGLVFRRKFGSTASGPSGELQGTVLLVVALDQSKPCEES